MLERFARGSRRRKTNCASGKTSSRNGTRSAFLGVFSSSRTLAPDPGARPSRSWIRPAKRWRSSVTIADVASLRVSRLERAMPRPGRSAAMLSMSWWLSPPIVYTPAAWASVSNSSVLPARGAERITIGRSSAGGRCGSGGGTTIVGSSAMVPVSTRGTSTVGSSTCGISTVGRLLSVGSSPGEGSEMSGGGVVPAPNSIASGREPAAPPNSIENMRASMTFCAILTVLAMRTGRNCRNFRRVLPARSSNRPRAPGASPCRYQSERQSWQNAITVLVNAATAAADSGRASIGARSARRSSASCSTSEAGISGQSLNRSIINCGRAAGSNPISFARWCGRSKFSDWPCITSRQNSDVPAVSATRCTRASADGFSTRCWRQLSKTQASPPAMWTSWSPQKKRTSGCVITGMCTRTRKNQWWMASLCSGTLPPPAIRISRERDQTVEKEASTCCRYGLASRAGVGAIAPTKTSVCVPPTEIRRAAVLPSYSCGCRDQALAGNASSSARRRSASKRIGRRKNGFGSFNPPASFVARAEAEARRHPVGERLAVDAGDHAREQRAVEGVHPVLLLEQVVHERRDFPATVGRRIADARVGDGVRLLRLDRRAQHGEAEVVGVQHVALDRGRAAAQRKLVACQGIGRNGGGLRQVVVDDGREVRQQDVLHLAVHERRAELQREAVRRVRVKLDLQALGFRVLVDHGLHRAELREGLVVLVVVVEGAEVQRHRAAEVVRRVKERVLADAEIELDPRGDVVEIPLGIGRRHQDVGVVREDLIGPEDDRHRRREARNFRRRAEIGPLARVVPVPQSPDELQALAEAPLALEESRVGSRLLRERYVGVIAVERVGELADVVAVDLHAEHARDELVVARGPRQAELLGDLVEVAALEEVHAFVRRGVAALGIELVRGLVIGDGRE